MGTGGRRASGRAVFGLADRREPTWLACQHAECCSQREGRRDRTACYQDFFTWVCLLNSGASALDATVSSDDTKAARTAGRLRVGVRSRLHRMLGPYTIAVFIVGREQRVARGSRRASATTLARSKRASASFMQSADCGLHLAGIERQIAQPLAGGVRDRVGNRRARGSLRTFTRAE